MPLLKHSDVEDLRKEKLCNIHIYIIEVTFFFLFRDY